jgi:hypothetical protein
MRRSLVLFAPVFVLLLALPARSEVTFEWVAVGDPGNACDDQGLDGCFGSVAYAYEIGKFEVTNAQYAELLNAVAATDANDLYYESMGSSSHGGITRSGDPGSYSYAAKAGFEDKPVNYVSFYDALRFANWLHNGQPTGAQDAATTEDGAYTITPEGISANSITRNARAKFAIPDEDEWYKAAYYDGASDYYEYPAASDTPTSCAAPGATPNAANCDDAVSTVTDVGAYTASPSPSGTFDQGGNVEEWNETILLWNRRGLRGGGYSSRPSDLAASSSSTYGYAWLHYANRGFRIEPVTAPVVITLTQIGGTYDPALNPSPGDTLVLDIGYAIMGTDDFVTAILPAIAFDPAMASFTGGSRSGIALWSDGAVALTDVGPESFEVHSAGPLDYVSGLGKVDASATGANAPCVSGACASLGTLSFVLTGDPGVFDAGAVRVPTPSGTQIESVGGDISDVSRLGTFAVAVAPDWDGDGVPDLTDNCSEVYNRGQYDGDQDGFGDACDCDYSTSAANYCDGADFANLAMRFGTFAPPTNCEFDHVPNGYIDGADFVLFVGMFGRAPGPSCDLAPGGTRGTPCPTPGAVCP